VVLSGLQVTLVGTILSICSSATDGASARAIELAAGRALFEIAYRDRVDAVSILVATQVVSESL
jgi:hypothetical protein